MSLRVCSKPGCPTLTTQAGYCAEHNTRGTTTQRGYGKAHLTERARWAAIIAHTSVPCVRCHTPITAGMTWHLDHDDNRSKYLGPSHATCNLSAAGKASHRPT